MFYTGINRSVLKYSTSYKNQYPILLSVIIDEELLLHTKEKIEPKKLLVVDSHRHGKCSKSFNDKIGIDMLF